MSILFGALIGVAYAITPGPVNLATMRRTLISGVLSGVALQLGSLVGGLPYAVLTSAGVGQLASRPPIHVALGLTGATVLLFLGWSGVRYERRFIEWVALRFARLRSGRGDHATIADAPAVMSSGTVLKTEIEIQRLAVGNRVQQGAERRWWWGS